MSKCEVEKKGIISGESYCGKVKGLQKRMCWISLNLATSCVTVS